MPPARDSTMASARNWIRIWPLVAPSARPAAAARCGGIAGIQQPVGDVAEHGLVLGEEELLEHEPDPGRPQRRQLAVGHRRRVQAGDADGPGGRLVQGAHQVQQRGLA